MYRSIVAHSQQNIEFQGHHRESKIAECTVLVLWQNTYSQHIVRLYLLKRQQSLSPILHICDRYRSISLRSMPYHLPIPHPVKYNRVFFPLPTFLLCFCVLWGKMETSLLSGKVRIYEGF